MAMLFQCHLQTRKILKYNTLTGKSFNEDEKAALQIDCCRKQVSSRRRRSVVVSRAVKNLWYSSEVVVGGILFRFRIFVKKKATRKQRKNFSSFVSFGITNERFRRPVKVTGKGFISCDVITPILNYNLEAGDKVLFETLCNHTVTVQFTTTTTHNHEYQMMVVTPVTKVTNQYKQQQAGRKCSNAGVLKRCRRRKRF